MANIFWKPSVSCGPVRLEVPKKAKGKAKEKERPREAKGRPRRGQGRPKGGQGERSGFCRRKMEALGEEKRGLGRG